MQRSCPYEARTSFEDRINITGRLIMAKNVRQAWPRTWVVLGRTLLPLRQLRDVNRASHQGTSSHLYSS